MFVAAHPQRSTRFKQLVHRCLQKLPGRAHLVHENIPQQRSMWIHVLSGILQPLVMQSSPAHSTVCGDTKELKPVRLRPCCIAFVSYLGCDWHRDEETTLISSYPALDHFGTGHGIQPLERPHCGYSFRNRSRLESQTWHTFKLLEEGEERKTTVKKERTREVA